MSQVCPASPLHGGKKSEADHGGGRGGQLCLEARAQFTWNKLETRKRNKRRA